MLVLIGLTVLTIINLVLYHKIFHIIYFNLGKQLLEEIIGSFLAAILELAIIMTVGQALLGAILPLLGGLLVLVVIVAMVAGGIYVIYRIVKMVKGKKENIENDNLQSNESSTETGMDVCGETEQEDLLNVQAEKKETDKGELEPVTTKIQMQIECQKCGKVLKSNTKFCNFCGEPNLLYLKKCPICGKQIKSDAKFCNFCGEPFV